MVPTHIAMAGRVLDIRSFVRTCTLMVSEFSEHAVLDLYAAVSRVAPVRLESLPSVQLLVLSQQAVLASDVDMLVALAHLRSLVGTPAASLLCGVSTSQVRIAYISGAAHPSELSSLLKGEGRSEVLAAFASVLLTSPSEPLLDEWLNVVAFRLDQTLVECVARLLHLCSPSQLAYILPLCFSFPLTAAASASVVDALSNLALSSVRSSCPDQRLVESNVLQRLVSARSLTPLLLARVVLALASPCSSDVPGRLSASPISLLERSVVSAMLYRVATTSSPVVHVASSAVHALLVSRCDWSAEHVSFLVEQGWAEVLGSSCSSVTQLSSLYPVSVRSARLRQLSAALPDDMQVLCRLALEAKGRGEQHVLQAIADKLAGRSTTPGLSPVVGVLLASLSDDVRLARLLSKYPLCALLASPSASSALSFDQCRSLLRRMFYLGSPEGLSALSALVLVLPAATLVPLVADDVVLARCAVSMVLASESVQAPRHIVGLPAALCRARLEHLLLEFPLAQTRRVWHGDAQFATVLLAFLIDQTHGLDPFVRSVCASLLPTFDGVPAELVRAAVTLCSSS